MIRKCWASGGWRRRVLCGEDDKGTDLIDWWALLASGFLSFFWKKKRKLVSRYWDLEFFWVPAASCKKLAFLSPCVFHMRFFYPYRFSFSFFFWVRKGAKGPSNKTKTNKAISASVGIARGRARPAMSSKISLNTSFSKTIGSHISLTIYVRDRTGTEAWDKILTLTVFLCNKKKTFYALEKKLGHVN